MTTDAVKHRRAYLYALVALLLWSTIASAFKISLRHLDILCLLFYATLTSTGVFFAYLAISGKLALLKAFTRDDYLRSAALGFLNPFLYYIVLLKAYSILPAQEAQPINFTWPLMLVLLSIPLLHQRISTKSIFAVVISFCGVFVIATRGNILAFRFTNLTGVGLALGSTIVWASFWIYNVRDKRDEAARLFVNFLFASAYICLAVVIFKKARIPSAAGILGAAYIGLCEMGLTFLAWLRALKLAKTTAHVVSLIYLVPFLSLIVIYFVLGEKIFPSTIIGVVLIVGGIVLQKIWS